MINTTTAHATVLVESSSPGTAAYNTGALWVVEALTFHEVRLFVEDYLSNALFRDNETEGGEEGEEEEGGQGGGAEAAEAAEETDGSGGGEVARAVHNPSGSGNGTVLDLTSRELMQKVKQSKYVLLQLYAPWCGFCKGLEPAYAALAAAFPSLAVAKLDTDANFTPEPYDSMWSELPTLLLFGGVDKSKEAGSSGGAGASAGDGSTNLPIKYASNHRELHRLVKFVEDHTDLRRAN